MGTWRYTATAVVAVAVCTLLSACGSDRGDNVPMPVPTKTASASPSAAPAPAPDPTLLPGGTALANLAYFDFVNAKLLAVNADPSTDAIIENLVNSGFAAGDIEVTPDKTDVLRRPADSIEFSVKSGEGCLLGQFQAGGYSSAVGEPADGGTCLIGATATHP